MDIVYNFGAGPGMLPKVVLQQIEASLSNWQGLGISVMEISHRSKEFIACAKEAEQDLRDLLAIPDNYHVLFCQGGAKAQFSLLPLNLLQKTEKADYVVSGYWSNSAAKDASLVCQVNPIEIRQTEQNNTTLLPMSQWPLSADTPYLHYCPNETIDGSAIFEEPYFKDKIVFADLSSTILSQPIDVSKYGVVYAGAQKNMGPAGLTLIIVRDDLIAHQPQNETLSSVFNYKMLAEHDSMLNTPPTFVWYVIGLVFKWLKAQGGVTAIAAINQQKAALLYDTIDQSALYHNNIAHENRSRMNVIFTLSDPTLEARFFKEAKQAGFIGLEGHRVIGGVRASLYNAMPIEGVIALTEFMKTFEAKYC